MKRRISTLLFFLILVFPLAAQKPIRDLKPTPVLISIDGLRYDYLDKYKPKNLNLLARNGVRAKWMIPSYPTLTFPNHYTIATGLHSENHGIVGNSMYDPMFDATFSLSKSEEVQNGRWWLGEPIWSTAEKQGQKAGAYFFPGTEAEIAGARPTYWKKFNDKVPNPERVDTILSWLDLPLGERPTFYTLYFSDVDHAGHDFSPDAPETRKAVNDVDGVIGRLVEGLKRREVFQKVNLIIVSDHGMATVLPTNQVVLDDYFDAGKIERIVWGKQITQIYPKAGEENAVIIALTAKTPQQAKCYRKEDIPSRFHYRNSNRIAPVVCLAQEGWNITSRKDYEKDKKEGKAATHNTGSHGYDNDLESMRATFIAHGAAFKRKTVVEPFPNVNVYYIMTKILNLKPAPNDGTPETAKVVLKRF